VHTFTVILCEEPLKPELASVHFSGTQFGDVATFTCYANSTYSDGWTYGTKVCQEVDINGYYVQAEWIWTDNYTDTYACLGR